MTLNQRPNKQDVIETLSGTNLAFSHLIELKRKWTIDLNIRKSGEVTTPPGYNERPNPAAQVKEQNQDTLVAKRSWDIALGPIRQIPMNIFIMWMAGNSISIFPIMMVVMTFLRPVQALFSISTTFQMIEGNQAHLQRIVFLLGNLLVIALAVYKCHTMGLLPTYESDWLSFIEPPTRAEFIGGGVTL